MKMQNPKQNKKSKSLFGLGLLTAFTASLCCITPVLALLAGTGGLAASFSFMEPARPYLIGITILVLGFAWYQKSKSISSEKIECACEDVKKMTFWQSKIFLGIVTVFAALLLAFPYYSAVFYSENKPKAQVHTLKSVKDLTLKVKGMTCESCNLHVENTLSKLPGHVFAKADYKTGTVIVKFDTSKSSQNEVKDAVNSTGYKIIN